MITRFEKKTELNDSKYSGKKWSRRKTGSKIVFIVVHYTGTPSNDCSADRAYQSILRSRREASTHFLVGNDGVLQILDEDKQAWHVGGESDAKKHKMTCFNSNSIGVDIVEGKVNTKSGKVEDCDWYFSQNSISYAAELIAMLCIKHGISAANVVRHYDVTGKQCPRPFCGYDKNTAMGDCGQNLWRAFISRVEREIEKRISEQ